MTGAAFSDLNGAVITRRMLLLRVFTMAVYTPAHCKRGYHFEFFHSLDFTVTPSTVKALSYMSLMGKTCMVRKVVNLVPADRFAVFITLAEELNVRAVRAYIFMALHTGTGIRYSSVLRPFYIYMAKLTIDP